MSPRLHRMSKRLKFKRTLENGGSSCVSYHKALVLFKVAHFSVGDQRAGPTGWPWLIAMRAASGGPRRRRERRGPQRSDRTVRRSVWEPSSPGDAHADALRIDGVDSATASFSFLFFFFFSFFCSFSFFIFFPSPESPPRPSLPPGNIAVSYKSLHFKARFWVREKKEKRRKKNAPTESGPLPQPHAQDIFVISCVETPHSDLVSVESCYWSTSARMYSYFATRSSHQGDLCRYFAERQTPTTVLAHGTQ